MKTYTVTSRNFSRDYRTLKQALYAARAVAEIQGEGYVRVTSGGVHVMGYQAAADAPADLYPAVDVCDSLHFPTEVKLGSSFNHIVSTAAFVVETESRTIRRGDPLCRRSGRNLCVAPRFTTPTCPGCIAVAQGLAARDAEVGK